MAPFCPQPHFPDLGGMLRLAKPVSQKPTPIFTDLPPPSEEVAAIVWVLETSTDPRLVDVAADLALDVQWPVNRDPHNCLKRLSDTFNGCFIDDYIRDGMVDHATSYIRAFGLLEMVNTGQPEGGALKPSLWEHGRNEELPTITTIVQYGDRSPNVLTKCVVTQWALRFISAGQFSEGHLEWLLRNFQPDEASLCNLSVLADFLFCINSFFAHPSIQDLSLMDKSVYCVNLTTRVFQNLVKCLTDSDPLDLDIATKIINKILLFKSDDRKPIYSPGADSDCRNAMYSFCALPNLAQSTRTLALQLARVDNVLDDSKPMETAWVYSALNQLWLEEPRDIDVIGDFLQVVVHSRPLRDNPTPDALNTILWAMLSYPDHSRTQSFTYHLLCSVENWFEDDQLRPILQEKSIWTLLGKYNTWNPTAYISLGDKLSQTPEWKVIITQDYFQWFMKLPKLLALPLDNEVQRGQKLMSGFSHVWDVDPTQFNQFKGDEKILTMAFTVVAKLWDQFNFPDTHGIQDLLQLTQCTLTTACCARHIPDWCLLRPSQDFRDVIVVRLGNAMSQAVDRIKATNPYAAEVEGRGVEILSKLVVLISGELRARPTPENLWDYEERQYWEGLKRNFEEEIDSVRRLLENRLLVTADVQVESPMS
ncbi:hypothetical protein C8R44DRAFT_355610 [Mycena epipterygia]|nr:hypothetical protein C8R44DRAFT_355610 [Mycena epipterygia]